MAFSRRMAALSAVVLIPLGIAATSFALADNPESPKVPATVELDSGPPSPTISPGTGPSPTPKPSPTPSDEVVRPPVTDSPTGDDDDDDSGQGDADDGPGDDGPGDN
ncbi:small secreted hydrophilic protein [Streptomyces sp. NBC_00286]|uniref:small secreted hydrophilic protein n=1 Tax=Streptomyces sp. NBC_00286 TaxID=2975701 RepID=UPI002E27E157|nr:small secreted hydrophilic protein [Streptomyces sp. NBC_00286]